MVLSGTVQEQKCKAFGNCCNRWFVFTATFLTLFVLPLLYAMFSKIGKSKRIISATAILVLLYFSFNAAMLKRQLQNHFR